MGKWKIPRKLIDSACGGLFQKPCGFRKKRQKGGLWKPRTDCGPFHKKSCLKLKKKRQKGGKIEVNFVPKTKTKKKKKKRKQAPPKPPKKDWGDWRTNRKSGQHYYICDDGMMAQCARKLSEGDPKRGGRAREREGDAWRICSAQYRKFCPT